MWGCLNKQKVCRVYFRVEKGRGFCPPFASHWDFLKCSIVYSLLHCKSLFNYWVINFVWKPHEVLFVSVTLRSPLTYVHNSLILESKITKVYMYWWIWSLVIINKNTTKKSIQQFSRFFIPNIYNAIKFTNGKYIWWFNCHQNQMVETAILNAISKLCCIQSISFQKNFAQQKLE